MKNDVNTKPFVAIFDNEAFESSDSSQPFEKARPGVLLGLREEKQSFVGVEIVNPTLGVSRT